MHKSQNRRYSTFFRLNLESISLALILAFLIRLFVLSPFTISGNSTPPLLESDKVLVNRMAYLFHKPRKGDIVVFSTEGLPGALKKDLIKRIAGLPGETVSIVNEHLRINGKKIEEGGFKESKYLFDPDQGMKYGGPETPFTVPEDTYYVLGDPSQDSRDSRYFGALSKKSIKGKAFFIYWPLKHAGWIQ